MPLESSSNSTEVAIIGAGVAGIYASYCCGVSGVPCFVFDSQSCPGGQCMAFYPDKKVYGVPAFSDILARDFVELLKNQAAGFSSSIPMFNEKITKISKVDNIFQLKTERGNKYEAKKVIIATGAGDMQPNIPQTIKGLGTGEAEGFVKYYCMRMDLYKDKEVIIAGGGDSAADFAINISRIAKKVTIIHRRDCLTCEEMKKGQIEKLNNVILKFSHNIQAIEGNKKVITDQESFEADYVVFCYGFRSTPCQIDGLASLLNTEGNRGSIEVNINTMETNCRGIFAIGDIACYKNKKKNIISCFFEADRAVRIIQSQLVAREL